MQDQNINLLLGQGGLTALINLTFMEELETSQKNTHQKQEK